jgi:thiazolylpeptide-type bacteriocin precursor
MGDHLDLSVLAKELQALETETFEIVDYTETSDLLTAVDSAGSSTSSSCSSTCSTCSTTSCCA